MGGRACRHAPMRQGILDISENFLDRVNRPFRPDFPDAHGEQTVQLGATVCNASISPSCSLGQ
jgi:hypothetical protein